MTTSKPTKYKLIQEWFCVLTFLLKQYFTLRNMNMYSVPEKRMLCLNAKKIVFKFK